MYYSQDMIRCAEQAGLTIEKIYDDLGIYNFIRKL